ncbi:MerR family transcriptional regulator [Desulfolithobacter sp.]
MNTQTAGSSVQIPEKKYFRIGEVSKLVGVDPHVLRYWESEFKTIRPRRAKSRQRLYRRKDVETLLLIKTLLHEEGYTIAGARKVLADGGRRPVVPKPGPVLTGSGERLAFIRKELQAIQDILERRE